MLTGSGDVTTGSIHVGSLPASGISVKAGVQISGVNINLSNNTLGRISGPSPGSAIQTNASGALNFQSCGAIDVVNNSGASVVSLGGFVGSLDIVNNATAGGGVQVKSLQALNVHSLTYHGGAITVGTAGVGSLVNAAGSISLIATGSGAAGDITVADSTSLGSTLKGVTITSGTGVMSRSQTRLSRLWFRMNQACRYTTSMTAAVIPSPCM